MYVLAEKKSLLCSLQNSFFFPFSFFFSKSVQEEDEDETIKKLASVVLTQEKIGNKKNVRPIFIEFSLNRKDIILGPERGFILLLQKESTTAQSVRIADSKHLWQRTAFKSWHVV